MRTVRLIPLLFALLALANPSCAAPGDAIQAAFTKTHRPLYGRFLHITDFHLDKYYRAGTTIKSSCHDRPKKNHLRKWLSGELGTPGTSCDSPFALVDATIDWIKKKWMDKIDFIVWTGDGARHDSDNSKPRTEKEIRDNNKYITNLLLKAFTHIAPASSNSNSTSTFNPSPLGSDLFIPIVASIGNNDVYPHNILGPGPNNPTLNAFLNMWKPIIPEDQLHTFQEGGWYVTEVIPGALRILALNTMYFFKSNAAVDGCHGVDEPGRGQMEWMEVQLQRARMGRMKVYLTGHVPPKRKNYFPSCWKMYGQLSLKYHDVIIGHLYGHMNIDHFFLMSKEEIDGVEDYPYNEEEDGEIDSLSQGAPDDSEEWTSSLPTRPAESSFFVDSPLMAGDRKYLEQLFEQYSGIRPDDDGSRHVVINVSPPVVPNFHPTFRVFHYDMRSLTEGNKKEVVPVGYTQFFANLTKWNPESEEDDSEEDDSDDDENGGGSEDKDKYKDEGNNGEDSLGKPKKRKKRRNPSGYLEYEIEYSTANSYGMLNLTSQSWLDMARRLASEGRGGEGMWRKYVERMFVHTRNGSDWA